MYQTFLSCIIIDIIILIIIKHLLLLFCLFIIIIFVAVIVIVVTIKVVIFKQIRCTQISISGTKCHRALRSNSSITQVEDYRQLSVP